MAAARLQRRQSPQLARRGDGTHGARRIAKRSGADIVGVGEGGFLAGASAHADALVDGKTARLDDTFFKAPCLGTAVLKVEIGVVHAMLQNRAEDIREIARAQCIGRQQHLFGTREQRAVADNGFQSRHDRPYLNMRCCSAGRLARVSAMKAWSTSPMTMPGPFNLRSRMLPHGSMSMLLPWVSRPFS